MTFTSRTGTHPEEGVKAPVVVASLTADGNLTLSGEQTVNSVAVVAGDRVLVKDQTDPAENGIYVVATSAWTRATDFNNANDVASGLLVVDDTNDAVWKAEFTGDYTPGTTEVTFSAVFETATPADGSITTAKLDANAVTLAKLARMASAYILIGKGTGTDVAAVAVSGDITISNTGVVTIANSAVETAMINDNAVSVAEMARAASGYLLVGQGTGSNLAFVAVSGDVTISNTGEVTIANAAVEAAMLASNAVTTAKILDTAVTEAKLSAAVQTKLNAGGTRNVLVDGGSTTSATEYEITGINSGANKVEIFFHMDPAGDNQLTLQLGHGGTPTYVAAGYAGADETTTWSTKATTDIIQGSEEIYGTITLNKLNSTIWQILITLCCSGSARAELAQGYVDVGATLTAAKLAFDSTAFDLDFIHVVEYY